MVSNFQEILAHRGCVLGQVVHMLAQDIDRDLPPVSPKDKRTWGCLKALDDRMHNVQGLTIDFEAVNLNEYISDFCARQRVSGFTIFSLHSFLSHAHPLSNVKIKFSPNALTPLPFSLSEKGGAVAPI